MSYFHESLEDDTASVAKSEIFEEKSFLFLGRVSKYKSILYRGLKKWVKNNFKNGLKTGFSRHALIFN